MRDGYDETGQPDTYAALTAVMRAGPHPVGLRGCDGHPPSPVRGTARRGDAAGAGQVCPPCRTPGFAPRDRMRPIAEPGDPTHSRISNA